MMVYVYIFDLVIFVRQTLDLTTEARQEIAPKRLQYSHGTHNYLKDSTRKKEI